MSPLTDHARTRMQQRGILAAAIEALLDYGNARHLHSKGGLARIRSCHRTGDSRIYQ